jgi:hypothetical protein
MQQEKWFQAISSVTNGKLLTANAHSSKRLIRARACVCVFDVQDDLRHGS